MGTQTGYNLSMRTRWLFPLLLLALLAVSWAMVSPNTAVARPAVELTPFPTPTPGADGVIRYKVQPGDTLWRVAALAGISVDELRALNNLHPDEALQPGQILILGVGVSEKPTPTPGAGAQPTETPTPTPEPGSGALCVLLYDDENGNGLYDDWESPLADGAVSVTTRVGSVSLTEETGNNDFTCFQDLSEGEYIITMAVPKDYNPTTAPNVTLNLRAGDTTYVTFGAQRAEPNTPANEPARQKSPLLGIVGGFFLIGGIGLWIFATRRLRAQ